MMKMSKYVLIIYLEEVWLCREGRDAGSQVTSRGDRKTYIPPSREVNTGLTRTS